MSALPRPDVTGPSRALNDALHDLHHHAGWPSLRALARETGVSHTTVSKAFSQPAVPTWGTIELLVEAMDGDVLAFRDLWLTASTPAGAPRAAPRIAGRRAELAVVRRHLTSGSGLLLVLGEAGMGKTKLLATSSALVAADCFIATGSCLPLSSGVPMLAFADALQGVHDDDGGRWFAEALSASEPYVATSIQRLVPAVEVDGSAGVHPGADQSRHRLFVAVAATIKALSAVRPLALVLEDLHWADAGTLDLLEHLSTRGTAVPVVASYRTEDPATPSATSDWLGRVCRLSSAATLRLGPLSLDETAQQLSILLGQPAAPAAVTSIHARTEGLPLFTEQLAKAIDQDADRPMPELLADLLDARLVGVGRHAWAIAKVLGVADRGLTSAVVREAADLTVGELFDGLRELDARRLLSPTDPDVAQLRHPLLAEAIRRRLVAGEGVDQHRRLARVLAARPHPAAPEIALHWQRGFQPAEEVVWRVAAARAAANRFAVTEEMAQWRRVLSLYSDGHEVPGGPTWSEVYCAAIDAAWSLGLRAESQELVSAALSSSAGLEGRARADLYFRTATRSMAGMDSPESLRMADEAIAIYRAIEPTIDLALCLERRSVILRKGGRWEEAAHDLDEAAEVCRAVGDVGTLRWILGRRAWQAGVMGDPATALRGIAEAFELQPLVPDPSGDIRLGTAATDLLLDLGAGTDEIVAAGARGLAAAETWDAALFAGAMLRAKVVEALMRAGRVTEAASLLDRATARPGVSEVWLTQLSITQVAVAQGRLVDAADRAAALVGAEDATLDYRTETHLAAARIDLWRGLPTAALRHLLPLLKEVVGTDSARYAGSHLVLSARAAADHVEALRPGERSAARPSSWTRCTRSRRSGRGSPQRLIGAGRRRCQPDLVEG